MRFTSANEPASLAEVCKLAWHTFYGMQKASEDFENLRFEVWTIAISLDSLHSVGTTSLLIDRQPDKARWTLTFSKILTSLSGALRPLYSLVKLYLSSLAKERASIKNWLTHPDVTFEGITVQDFRRKLSMLVESLNVFLSCLTHAELARAKDVSESEEFRVLSEVTQSVLHKWDQDEAAGLRRPVEQTVRLIEPVGYFSDDVKNYMMPLLNNEYPGLGLQVPRPPPSLVPHQQHRNEAPSQHPGGVLNLDDIEHGFRSHIHAMRRIREQLRRQNINNDQLSAPRSPHFSQATANTKTHYQWGTHPPLTPTTPTLHRHMTDSTQSSDMSGEHADASSNTSSYPPSSESRSVIYNNLNASEEDTKPALTPRPQSTSSLGLPLRKRKRQSQFRFKTGLEADGKHPPSSDGEDSNDATECQNSSKTPLEELLTMVLFFDQ